MHLYVVLLAGVAALPIGIAMWHLIRSGEMN